ncbi:MBL fold metallo-hydrolase, partial [Carnobacterium sp.]
MKLTILGYWGGYPINNEGTSSYLVESEGYHLLIDAGSASLISLENHLDPLELDAVILSHYHHDHVADIGVLQFMR